MASMARVQGPPSHSLPPGAAGRLGEPSPASQRTRTSSERGHLYNNNDINNDNDDTEWNSVSGVGGGDPPSSEAHLLHQSYPQSYPGYPSSNPRQAPRNDDEDMVYSNESAYATHVNPAPPQGTYLQPQSSYHYSNPSLQPGNAFSGGAATAGGPGIATTTNNDDIYATTSHNLSYKEPITASSNTAAHHHPKQSSHSGLTTFSSIFKGYATTHQLLFLAIVLLQTIASMVLIAFIWAKIRSGTPDALKGDLLNSLPPDQRDDELQKRRSITVYLVIFLFGSVFEIVTALDALRLNNTIQLIGVCLFTAAMMVRGRRIRVLFSFSVEEPADLLPSPDLCCTAGRPDQERNRLFLLSFGPVRQCEWPRSPTSSPRTQS